MEEDGGDESDEDKQEPKQGWRRSCFNVVACTFYLQLCIFTTRDKAFAADMNAQRKCIRFENPYF